MQNIVGFNKKYTNEEIYEKYIVEVYSDLYKFIYSMVRNSYMAEDILQESFIKGFKHFNGLLSKDKFKPWIFTIAKHETLRQLKKVSREYLIDDQEWESEISKTFYFSSNPETSSELEEYLVEIINSLDAKNKEIIYLIYYLDLTFEDISAILNINLNTLKSKHKRIKEKIYNKLLDKGLINPK